MAAAPFPARSAESRRSCHCRAHLIWLPAEPDPGAPSGADGVAGPPLDPARGFDLARTGVSVADELAVARDCACAASPARTSRPSGALGRRLHGEIGLIPPAEHEDDFYRHNTAATTAAASVLSLH